MASVFPNSGRLSSKGKGAETRPKKGVLPGKLGAGRATPFKALIPVLTNYWALRVSRRGAPVSPRSPKQEWGEEGGSGPCAPGGN